MTGLLDGLPVEGRAPRLLFVHAHPDDETLATGVAIAHHVARGDDVHVLTCTLGEEGEVIPAHLAHLEGAPGDPLGAHRREELRARDGGARRRPRTCSATAGRRRVTRPTATPGWPAPPAAAHPRAWAGADLADAAAAVRAVLDDVRPDVVVTYDAHRWLRAPRPRAHPRGHLPRGRLVGRRARCCTPCSPRCRGRIEDRRWLAEHVPADRGLVVPGPDDPFASSVVPDEVVTHRVVDPSVVPVQARALLAHETQVVVGEGWYALSNHVVSRLAGREGFARLDAATGRPTSEDPA